MHFLKKIPEKFSVYKNAFSKKNSGKKNSAII